MNIATQTSRNKIHKVPILRLLKVPSWKTESAHLYDRNRTSSLFDLVLIFGKSLLRRVRCASRSSSPISSPFMEGGSPLPNHPPTAAIQDENRSRGYEFRVGNKLGE
jgi:hypothetical protein